MTGVSGRTGVTGLLCVRENWKAFWEPPRTGDTSQDFDTWRDRRLNAGEYLGTSATSFVFHGGSASKVVCFGDGGECLLSLLGLLSSRAGTILLDAGTTELLTITGSVLATVAGALGLSGMTSPLSLVPNFVVSSMEASMPEYLFCVASAEALLSGMRGELYWAAGVGRGVDANVAGRHLVSSLDAAPAGSGSAAIIAGGGGDDVESLSTPLVQGASSPAAAARPSPCRLQHSLGDLVAVTFVFSSPSEAESEDSGSSEKMPESS